MRKVIAAINMTLDGYCDHTAGIADEKLHQHYTMLLDNADLILYGRITYQLMQYWQTFLNHPSGEPDLDNFAVSIDRIPKLVFSGSLKNTGWHSARLAKNLPEEEILQRKSQEGREILVGSRSLIIRLLKKGLIDEFQICIHPVVEGHGLPLFEMMEDRLNFKLIKIKPFTSGAIVLYYQPVNKANCQGKARKNY